jgi:Cof subfamily protein (haloacid dehalogenase superfamily)
MIKALFFDLDGTLLNSKTELSDKTRITLKQCAKKGYKLFIATARPPLLERMLRNQANWDEDMLIDTLSLFTGGVYYNGGCIKIGEIKEYIYVLDEIVRNIIDIVQNHEKTNIALQFEGEKHAFRFPLEDKDYKRWGITADEVLTLNQANNMKAVKTLVFNSNLIDSILPIDEKLVSELKLICADNAQFCMTDRGICVQVMGKDVNKFSGVEKIRERYGFAKDEIAVFGDDTNDMEMLMEYPYSIAVGNAEPQVKAAAKYVTSDNDDDGVHEAICNILNLL